MLTELMGGQITMAFFTGASRGPTCRTGGCVRSRPRARTQFDLSRSDHVAEVGLPSVDSVTINGLVAPPGCHATMSCA